MLDWVSDRPTTQRYLLGNNITEADVRLFTTLARFDAVYHGGPNVDLLGKNAPIVPNKSTFANENGRAARVERARPQFRVGCGASRR